MSSKRQQPTKIRERFEVELDRDVHYSGEVVYGTVRLSRKKLLRPKMIRIAELRVEFSVDEEFKYSSYTQSVHPDDHTIWERVNLASELKVLSAHPYPFSPSTQVRPLFELCVDAIARSKISSKRLKVLPVEIRHLIKYKCWNFQFAIPNHFPPSFFHTHPRSRSSVLYKLQFSMLRYDKKMSDLKVIDLGCLELNILNYAQLPSISLDNIAFANKPNSQFFVSILELPRVDEFSSRFQGKIRSNTRVKRTCCDHSSVRTYSAGKIDPAFIPRVSYEISATTYINSSDVRFDLATVSLIQRTFIRRKRTTLTDSDVRVTLAQKTYRRGGIFPITSPRKHQLPYQKSFKLLFESGLSSDFIPEYQRKNGDFYISHYLQVELKQRGSCCAQIEPTIVTVPVRLYHDKPRCLNIKSICDSHQHQENIVLALASSGFVREIEGIKTMEVFY